VDLYQSLMLVIDREATLRKGNESKVLMFVASNMYFHIDFVSNMWKSSLIPLKTWEIHFNKLIIKVNAFM
jgi:hypothetical protein